MLEKPEHPVGPFGLLSIPSSRAEQLQCARNQARRFARLAAADRGRLGFKFSRARKARLRIGYLSSDLQAHATAYLMAELFELHDRGRFEVIAYSYAPDDGSAMRARLLRAFDRFADIAALSHADAARAIHGDGVDILVDLKGYTANARTEILALRPAPIQVSFVGYPGTMGDFADYLVGDRVVTPPAHAAGYSEKIVRLPGCYLPNDRKRAVGETPSRRDLGLPVGAGVFFCFNQPYKILPDTFSAWMRILDAAPRSVLWLLDWNPEATRNLQREAASRGVDPARLIFAPLLAQREHLGRTAAADLLLDTLPYNAHTVASDALWCGVPVLTCPGETFASRVAASQLTAAGMPEMIMPSMAEYEARAVRLAREPAELAALRRKLAHQRDGCALFDTPAFVRSLERGFTRMWDDYAAGRPLSDIDL
jgi:predicted O-linked N-acetylglucosamine transferase (SPINDLY family)